MPRLRLVVPADAARIAEIYAPNVTESVISFEETPPTADEMLRRMDAYSNFAPWLVSEEDDVVTGYAYASPHRDRAAYRWSVDVTVYVDRAHHRRGVGRALYSKLLRLLPLQGFCVAHAGITLPNAGSVGLHESFGFTNVGVFEAVGFKFDAWHDVGYWRLALRDRPARPSEVRPFADVRDSAAWRAAWAE